MLPEGKEGKIASINAGNKLKLRLTEMGFTENCSVKVDRADRGSLVVVTNGSKYALGKGIAMKIMITDSKVY